MTNRRRNGDATPARKPAEPVDVPELEDDMADDDDTADEDVRDAATLLGVPEWVDPETGELADDEHTRLEDH